MLVAVAAPGVAVLLLVRRRRGAVFVCVTASPFNIPEIGVSGALSTGPKVVVLVDASGIGTALVRVLQDLGVLAVGVRVGLQTCSVHGSELPATTVVAAERDGLTAVDKTRGLEHLPGCKRSGSSESAKGVVWRIEYIRCDVRDCMENTPVLADILVNLTCSIDLFRTGAPPTKLVFDVLTNA